MKVVIPHMGNTYIALRAIAESLGIDYITVPPNSERSLSLGVANAPEMVCLPMKTTLGNFIEGLEAGGDTLLFTEARGICRLGYYFRVQKQALKQLGYSFQAITLKEHSLKELYRLFKVLCPKSSFLKVLGAFCFGLAKLRALDRLEGLTHKVRPREKARGDTTAVYRKGIKAINNASTIVGVKKAEKEYSEELLNIQTNGVKPLKIGVMGEFFLVLDPFSNLNVEIELGKLGCEVCRTLFMSKWANFTLFLNPLGFDEARKLHRAATPYLRSDIGGDGWESVGEKVLRVGSLDGIVHLQPFGCLPEIVATNIMQSVPGVSTLHLSFDEQTGRAGMITRVEAFVDMLRRQKIVQSKGGEQ